MEKKYKIIFVDDETPGSDFSWPKFEKLGQVVSFPTLSAKEVVEKAHDADIILTNKVPLSRETIYALPKLKYIGSIATGYNIIDVEAASERGIVVCNAPDYSTYSVMQHTFALILDLCSHITLHANAVRDGEWLKSKNFCFWKEPGRELLGKTLGVIGFGNIGQKVAEMGHHFGMNVLAYAPRPKEKPHYRPFDFVDLQTLYKQADIVSLHCPLTPENDKMINADVLQSMKNSALLINCSRGGLVDEQALRNALDAGIIAGAGLDVVSREPMRADNPLLNAPHCIITPHIAWTPVEARARLLEIVYQNVENFILGKPSNVVNSPK